MRRRRGGQSDPNVTVEHGDSRLRRCHTRYLGLRHTMCHNKYIVMCVTPIFVQRSLPSGSSLTTNIGNKHNKVEAAQEYYSCAASKHVWSSTPASRATNTISFISLVVCASASFFFFATLNLKYEIFLFTEAKRLIAEIVCLFCHLLRPASCI
jgi:hypothetical protein